MNKKISALWYNIEASKEETGLIHFEGAIFWAAAIPKKYLNLEIFLNLK